MGLRDLFSRNKKSDKKSEQERDQTDVQKFFDETQNFYLSATDTKKIDAPSSNSSNFGNNNINSFQNSVIIVNGRVINDSSASKQESEKIVVHRLIAKRTFSVNGRTIQEGEELGYVESVKNIQGNAVVGVGSVVYGDGVVKDDAIIEDSEVCNSVVSGSAKVKNCSLFGMSEISDNAQVEHTNLSGCSKISGQAVVLNSSLSGNSEISGQASVDCSSLSGNSQISGETNVSNSSLSGNSSVSDRAIVSTSSISGNSKVCDDAEVQSSSLRGGIIIDGTRTVVSTSVKGESETVISADDGVYTSGDSFQNNTNSFSNSRIIINGVDVTEAIKKNQRTK